ncbi:MAG: hypothetical protein PF517_10075 [Salinivirgaceae bacterium]|jgi:hypothetical protein|nr:hypothetical protein [Salinivirgaceae bacterium]
MKHTKTKLIILILLAIFACNNKQTTNTKNSTPAIKSELRGDSIPNKKDSTKQTQLKICENLVTEILTTSPRYIQMTKGLKKAIEENGGTSYGLSLSVKQNSLIKNPLSNSKIYEFTLYETYQERQLNTARFTFDPVKKQLYEYDAVEDTMKRIEFNKNLLVELDSCFK